MLAAAESAWDWAVANPSITYKQPDDIKTGEYGDGNLADEFAWAAAELYITSKKDSYYTAMKPTETFATVPSWGDVRGLGWISLAHHRENLTAIADQQLIVSRIIVRQKPMVLRSRFPALSPVVHSRGSRINPVALFLIRPISRPNPIWMIGAATPVMKLPLTGTRLWCMYRPRLRR